MIIPSTILKTRIEDIPVKSKYLKRIEDCESDEEFLGAVEESVMLGEFGHHRNKAEIIPYMIHALTYSPRRIVGYIENNTPPEVAWEVELELGPPSEDGTPSGTYSVASMMRLESARRKMYVREAVMSAIIDGACSTEEVYRRIHPSHTDIDIMDVSGVFDLLVADGILG